MAVPGDVRGGANRGGHALLRDGARLVERAADVLDELGWRPSRRRRAAEPRRFDRDAAADAACCDALRRSGGSDAGRLPAAGLGTSAPTPAAAICSISSSPGWSCATARADSCPPNGSGNVGAQRMSKPLVIVESPAKARTLARFLGNQYRVEASVGHVRDLPENASEVPEGDQGQALGPHGRRRRERLPALLRRVVGPHAAHPRAEGRVKDADQVLLATDPDREGESISWHLREILKPKVPVKRIVFHEITEEAVREAIADAHDIDAQPRRCAGEPAHPRPPLRLHAVAGALEEGADRPERRPRPERRRPAHRRARRRAARLPPQHLLGPRRPPRRGRPRVHGHAREDRRRAPRDRQGLRPRHRPLQADKVRLLDESRGRVAGRVPCRGGCPGRSPRSRRSPTTQRPYAPFTTSTLQQEANRKLGYSADRTMRAAQRLFQEGIISYHRTDSTTLSDRALREAAAGDSRPLRQRVLWRSAAVPDEGQERPGGPRSHSAHRLRPDAPGDGRPDRLGRGYDCTS